METKISGNYFDGQSARPIPVEVNFGQEGLSFFSAEANIVRDVLFSEIRHIRHVGNDRLILNFNSESTEGIDITAPNFVAQFREAYPSVSSQHFLLSVKGLSNRKVLAILGTLLSLIAVIYFFVIPFVGEISTRLITKENEIALGDMIYKNLIADYTVDTPATRLVNDIVHRIDFQTTYPLKVTVVHYKEKNAFALPGGHIVVFSGLLDKMNDYAELAGLLSHEVSHINHQHSLRAMFRNLSSYIFISVIFSDVNGISTVIVDNADKFKTLSFSRKLEEEADREGLKIMLHNQIDPEGMLRLFKVLMQDDHEVHDHLEFLSSHPLTQNRIRYIEKQIKQQTYTPMPHPELDSLWISLKADY